MGELIALIVAFSWTITALFAEIASKKIGSTTVNVIRMALSLTLLAILLWVTTGAPYPQYAGKEAWFWLIASGLVGYVFGDFCLFNSYLIIGSRFGQLFMTLSSVFAAFAGFLLLGETLAFKSLIAMAVTLTGIGISVMAEKEGHAVVSDDGLVAVPEKKFSIKSIFKRKKVRLKVPFKGVLLGIGAAMGQGVGLVLSKQGVMHYSENIAGTDFPPFLVPFAGTYIRAIMGLGGFLVMIFMQKKAHLLREAFHNSKGIGAAVGTTIFGPFIGVSLSLMAVQYTATGIAQTIMALTPVLILLPAHIFLHQKITLQEVLGAFISIAGVALFFFL